MACLLKRCGHVLSMETYKHANTCRELDDEVKLGVRHGEDTCHYPSEEI